MRVTRRTVLRTALAAAAATPFAAAVPRPAAADDAPGADFFGAWDAGSATWSTPPRLDYTRTDLAGVAAAARAGDYPTAAAELLTYQRNRPARTPPDWSYNGVYRPELVPLFLDHIWTLGKGEIYRSTLRLGTGTAEVTADVTDPVIGAASAGGVGFMLMARKKGTSTARFASRHAGSGAPRLALTLADGGTTSVPATPSTYIAAGGDADTVFGGADTLLVADDGTGPYSDTTRKAYLWFDLPGTGTVTAATLHLTGSADTAMDVLLYQEKESFDESSRCWSNTVQNTFSWQGDPGGFDWRKPAGADNEYGYQLPRFYFAGPIADAYASDRDETVAAGLIGLMTDFIADADGYAEDGAARYPRNLDAAARFQNWCYAYEILRTSPSLTAADNARIVSTMDRAGRYLATTTSDTPNWMITIRSTLVCLGVCLPELVDAKTWRDNGQDDLDHQLSDALYPDGGYREASSTYAMGVAQSFVAVGKVLSANGFPIRGASALRKLAWYLADQTYPNGFDPAYGDSSYGDQRDDLAALAGVLDDAGLRYVATGGADGTAPDHTSVSYPDTRVAVQRTGWRPTDWYLRLNADRGAHSHPDELAIQLYAHDRPLLPAMGAFTYSSDPKADWLRTTTIANNTVTIDDTAQDSTADGGVDLVVAPWIQLASGRTDGTPGVRHERDVLLLPGIGWLVADTLTPADTAQHRYEQTWHLLPDANPDLAGGVARTRFADGTQLVVVPAEPDRLTASLPSGWYSRVTYEVTAATYVSYALRAAGPTHLDTLLRPVPPGDGSTATLAPAAAPDGGRVVRVTYDGGSGFLLRATAGALRRVGGYRTDAALAYLTADRALLRGGTTLRHGTDPVLAADRPLGTVALRWDRSARTVELAGPGVVAGGDPVRLCTPWADRVTVAGTPVPFTAAGDVLTVDALA